MNDKNILIAITPEIKRRSLLNFISKNLEGQNLKVTVCVLLPEMKEDVDLLLDSLAEVCDAKGVDIKIKHLVGDAYKKLKELSSYADLLLIQKESIREMKENNQFVNLSCPVMMLPEDFTQITNIILVLDGTRRSVSAIKQFCQIFSNQIKNVNLTLLSVYKDAENNLNPIEETMLLDYIKQYSKNIGVLKVNWPFTQKIFRPVQYDRETLVVGSVSFLISQYNEKSVFKPFYDEDSSIFIPAE